ncbi:MAG: Tfp pilus assembly protein FimT/FimU [Bryobacteraceae bacterium]
MRRAGVTLIEMLIVVTIVSLAATVTYPSLLAGLDSIRLAESAGAVANLLTGALNRVDRKQFPIEIAVSPGENVIQLTSTEAGYRRELKLKDGVSIREVHPKLPVETLETRRFLVLPGGAAPRIGIELGNRHGSRRLVRLDPVTGIAQIETPPAEP